MKRRHLVGVLVVLQAVSASITALGLLGCSGEPVGRKCDLGMATPQQNEVVVASQSLDCVTRTCLRLPSSRESPPPGSEVRNLPLNQGLCTAECSSDDDCERVPESPCVTGFTCGVAVTVGPYCCRKICICKDLVDLPESGELATPKACEASNADNTCCNLSGRNDNPDYPLCKS